MLKVVESLKSSLSFFMRCFFAALFFVAGCKVADLIIEDPSMIIVICENGAGACDRIREPVKTNWIF